MRMCLNLLAQGGYLSHGRLISCFPGDRKELQRAPLAPTVSQVTLVQKNQYAKVAHLGVPNFAPPQYLDVDRKGATATDVSVGSTVLCPLVGRKYLLNEFWKEQTSEE